MKESGSPGVIVREIFHAFWDAMMLAVLAGALWARLLAWLEGQALSYMLTMAAILVLYYVAELIGANGAITILLFGLVLSNMQYLVGRLAKPIRALIGYELDQAKFVLDAFLKRINEELSFLVRTFFYVLLGLMLDFSALTASIALTGLGLFVVVVAVRGMATEALGRMAGAWTGSERLVIAAMFPRGVATAVMAFLPVASGIPGTELFPMYALTVIVMGVVGMTIVLMIYQRWSSPVETHTAPWQNSAEAGEITVKGNAYDKDGCAGDRVVDGMYGSPSTGTSCLRSDQGLDSRGWAPWTRRTG
jgi:cell volume regulation protein A